MTNLSLARVTAVSLALGAFSIALIGGLASGAEANEVLFRAVVSLFVCYMVGYVLGKVGESVVDEAAQRSASDLGALAHGAPSPVQASHPVQDHQPSVSEVEVAN